MKSKLKIATLIILFALIFIYFYSIITTEVYSNLEGGVFSNEAVISEQVEITVDGSMDKRLFEGNVIIGTIRVGDGIFYDFLMTKDDGFYQGTIYGKDNNGEFEDVGKIATSNNLDLVWADFYELDEEYGVDTFVAGPAKNLEEGNNLRKDVFGE